MKSTLRPLFMVVTTAAAALVLPLLPSVSSHAAAPPNTVITGGVANNGFAPTRDITFTYASDNTEATFVCTFDGLPIACDPSGVELTDLESGEHTFTVAAVSGVEVDSTPARSHFSVYYDENVFRYGTNRWLDREHPDTFDGTFRYTLKLGQELELDAENVTRINILFAKGPDFGRFAIFWNKRKVRSVRTDSPTVKLNKFKKAVQFKNPRSGTLRIVTQSNQMVVIDGVGAFFGD